MLLLLPMGAELSVDVTVRLSGPMTGRGIRVDSCFIGPPGTYATHRSLLTPACQRCRLVCALNLDCLPKKVPTMKNAVL
jgi:hypothetical protein